PPRISSSYSGPAAASKWKVAASHGPGHVIRGRIGGIRIALAGFGHRLGILWITARFGTGRIERRRQRFIRPADQAVAVGKLIGKRLFQHNVSPALDPHYKRALFVPL